MFLRHYLIILSGVLATGPALAGNAKVAAILQTSTTSAGVPIVYPKTGTPEVTAVTIDIPPGGDIGEHMHPVPTFVYVLKGTIEVPVKGGATHHYKAGQAYMEVVNTPHNGVNKGNVPAELLAVFVGIKGVKNLQHVQ